jgi:hypothetical protein
LSRLRTDRLDVLPGTAGAVVQDRGRISGRCTAGMFVTKLRMRVVPSSIIRLPA